MMSFRLNLASSSCCCASSSCQELPRVALVYASFGCLLRLLARSEVFSVGAEDSGFCPKPSQLVPAAAKGTSQPLGDRQHPPSDRAAKAVAIKRIFIRSTHKYATQRQDTPSPIIAPDLHFGNCNTATQSNYDSAASSAGGQWGSRAGSAA